MTPDYTGVWELVRGKSDFGFLPPPRLRIDTILHDDSRLRIRTRQKDANGDLTVDRKLTIGADPVIIQLLGRARRVRAFWDALTLVMETSSDVSGNPRRIEDRWTLDPSGEYLTIVRRHLQPGGTVNQRLFLRRRRTQDVACHGGPRIAPTESEERSHGTLRPIPRKHKV